MIAHIHRCLGVLCLLAAIAVAPAVGHDWGNDIPVCTDGADQYSPDIYGQNIVWVDTRSGHPEIYTRYMDPNTMDGGPERRISTWVGEMSDPAIFGTDVVYIQYFRGNYSVVVVNLVSNETQVIASGPQYKAHPDISIPRVYPVGQKALRVVWQQANTAGSDILYARCFDGDRGFYIDDPVRLSTNPDSSEPRLTWDHVVWHGTIGEPDTDMDHEVYLYSFSTGTETRLTNGPLMEMEPAISGDRVVWMSTAFEEGILSNIIGYDIRTGTTRTLTNASPNGAPFGYILPELDGDNVVYSSVGDQHLYILDWGGGAPRRITHIGAMVPRGSRYAVQGGNVVWTDERNGNDDIWMADVPLAPLEDPHMVGKGTTWIRWAWADPPDEDVDRVAIIHLIGHTMDALTNGTLEVPLGREFANVTGLNPGSEYLFDAGTVDASYNLSDSFSGRYGPSIEDVAVLTELDPSQQPYPLPVYKSESREIRDLAVNESGFVFAEAIGSPVLVYSPDLTYLTAYGDQDLATYAVAIGPGDCIYAAGQTSQTSSSIRKYSPNGEVLADWPVHGTGFPVALAVDRAGNISVLLEDASGAPLQKYAPDGTFLFEWGSIGTGPGQLRGVDNT